MILNKDLVGRNKNKKDVNKQSIVDNPLLHNVLGRRVFHTDIFPKTGMESLF